MGWGFPKRTFGDSVTGKSPFPSAFAINNFLKTTPVSSLKCRTEAQVRTWLHTQKKQFLKSNNFPVAQQRIRTPKSIYILFSEHIKKKEMPSVAELATAYQNSPSLQSYSIKQLQEFLSRAIENKWFH